MNEAAGAVTVPTAAISTTAPIVETSLGPVRGLERDGIHSFLGIPYAAPPFGALRMRPPAPHEPWTEVRDATSHGATVPKSPYPPAIGVAESRVRAGAPAFFYDDPRGDERAAWAGQS
jgi:hypothetical protein